MAKHAGVHGRVFRGLKKNNHGVHFGKRADTIHHNAGGDRVIMRVPDGFAPQQPQANDDNSDEKSDTKLSQKAKADDSNDNDNDVQTVVEAVYVTLDQTFDGPPQFFSTQSVAPTSTSAAERPAQTTSSSDNSSKEGKDGDDETPSRKPVAQSTATSSSSSAENTSSATDSAASASKDEASATSFDIEVTSSSIATGDITSTRNAMLADNTSGMVGGTPIGATHSATPEPENTGMTGGAKAGLAMGIIFGLALVFGLAFFCWRRKKSQRGLEEHNEKNSMPAPVNRFSSDSDRLRRTSTQTSATAPRLSLRPVTQFLPNLTGENRKSIGNVIGANNAANQQNGAQNPFGDAAVLSEKSDPSQDRPATANSDNSQSVPATPGSAQFGTAAAVPVARGPNNVHRVQLEFKPSMEDELELMSGQLVRMLHEYDDGWALCTRMDRSEKGVVPRTCLSKMPVKPRGPPSQNGPPPAGPNAMRTPPGANNSPGMAPRPLTPQQQQQQSRARAPTLDGVPARKPVPGQAL